MRVTIYILLFFILGVVLSWQGWLPNFLLANDYSSYVLYVLMFLIGIGIGSDIKAWKTIRKMSLKVLLIPLATIVGTFLGLIVISTLMPTLNFWDIQAIGAGYGYYSLSSIIISEIRTETLGTIALIANVMREICTLLLAPLLARLFGKFAPISSGGATSMDTTLPTIIQSVGKEYAIISVFHGTILTILVPFIVPLFLSI